MKTRTFSKKLTLNKKTIADLNNGDMKSIHGGGDKPDISILFEICPTDVTCCTGGGDSVVVCCPSC
jgi:natural product precursor